MRRNAILEVIDVSNFSTSVAEPVTIAQFKNYARLQGFEDDNDSGEFPFTSDDFLIEQLITAVREDIEQRTGRSLVPHQWKARIENGYKQELPFSNGAEVTEVKGCNGVIDNPIIGGIDFKFIDGHHYGELEVSYETDGKCNEALRNAILVEVLYRYTNRGDLAEEGNMSEKAIEIIRPYKAKWLWVQ